MKHLIRRSLPLLGRSTQLSSFNFRTFSTADDGSGNNDQGEGPQPVQPRSLRQHNQVAAYRRDERVDLIIKESATARQNIQEREQFTKLVKSAAIGLYKNYKNSSPTSKKRTEDFKVQVAKNFDGRTFALFIKYVNELKRDVLERNNEREIEHSPDSFLIFLDKIKSLTSSEPLNEMILTKMANINIDLLKTKSLLNTYQKHSVDFKFEEKIRMGEIKKFAQDVIPESRFIFDRYPLDGEAAAEGTGETPGQDDDYFSFFGSHEQAILKPESSFKNLHELMTYLPIDYYILLQKGYKQEEAELVEATDTESHHDGQEQSPTTLSETSMQRSNMIMFNNLPVVNKKPTFYSKSNSIMKAITYEDVYRCLEKTEAKKMLSDTTAEEEMTKLLTEYYGGAIRGVEFINYDAERIVQSFHAPSGQLGKDHLNEFQQFIDYGQSKDQTKKKRASALDSLVSPESVDMNEYVKNQLEFDEIMTVSSDYFTAGSSRVQHSEKYQQALEREEILSHTKLDNQRAAQYVRARERELMGLDRIVSRSGFLIFDDYVTKLQMMDHPLFLFGLKLYDMSGAVEFFDADFCNTLVIKSDLFDQVSLQECCQMLNQILLRNGFMGKLLEVGQLKDISEDFDLRNIVVRSDYKIQLRFSNFEEAKTAYHALQSVNLPSDWHGGAVAVATELERRHRERESESDAQPIDQQDLEDVIEDARKLQITFQNPEPNYYDGKFATQFENCIKDKFEGLDTINEVPSDYVAQALKEHARSSWRSSTAP